MVQLLKDEHAPTTPYNNLAQSWGGRAHNFVSRILFSDIWRLFESTLCIQIFPLVFLKLSNDPKYMFCGPVDQKLNVIKYNLGKRF